MLTKRRLGFYLFMLVLSGIAGMSSDALGQTGPGGVGDASTNKIWLTANDSAYSDAGTTPSTNGGSIQEWHDRSGNGNDATQTTAGSQPTLVTGSMNGQSVVSFDGSSDWMSIVTADIPETNYTQFVIFKSSDVTGCFTAIASPATYTGGAHDRQFGLSSNKLSSRIWNTEVISSATDYNDNTARIAEIQVTSGVGQEIFINEASVKTGTKGGSDFNWEDGMVVGGHNAWGYYAGSIAEIILYNTVLNDAQQIIVNNYLSSKYGIAIVNDKFSYDASHFYDVAGIGREDASNMHTAAKSAGVLTISGADDLDDAEYLLFGHDNGSIASWTTTEAPGGGEHIERVAREWRVDETGDVGTVTLELDTALFPSHAASYMTYEVLVDADGDFSSGATAYPMTYTSGSLFEATGVPLSAGDYITFAIIEPVVEFAVTSSDDDEPNSPATITITLSYAMDADVTVDYDIIGGTAINGSDYTLAVPGTATITAGNTSVDISIPITNDTDIEDDEDIVLELSNPSLGTLGDNTQHAFTIHDDDNPRKIAFRTVSDSLDESITPGGFTIEINLTDGSNATSVDYAVTGGSATGGGTDYILASGTATVPAGEDSVTVDIFVNEDALAEADETIVVTLSNPINANLGADKTFTYTILDNDTEPAVEFALTSSSSLENSGTVGIQVHASTVAGQDITVDYTVTPGTATGGGVDYTLADGTLTIPKDSSYAFINVVLVNDGTVEGGETFTITLSNPANATLDAQDTHVFTISDDDNSGYTGPGGVGDANTNKIWLSANDEVYSDAGSTQASNGNSVQEWHDRSGNGNDAVQATGGSQPTLTTNSMNGQSVITFDGSSDWMGITTGDIPETNYTQFVIFKSSDGAGCFTAVTDPVSYSGGSHDRQFGLNSNKLSSRIWNNEVISSAGTYSDNTSHISEIMVTNGVGQEIYIDETSVQTGTKSASDFNWETGMVVGGHNAWGYYAGGIAEILLYNTVLNDAQQIIVNNYLSSKYGIAIVNDKYPMMPPIRMMWRASVGWMLPMSTWRRNPQVY